MKRMSATMCSTIIILAITGSTTAQSAQPTTLESELRDVLQRRWNALTRKDAKAYGALLDDDVLVPDNGSVYDKKTLIERVATIKETSTEPRDLRVHGDNHAAVIVYRTTSHVLLAGQEITEELRVVESYAKRNGRWLLTARAESEIPNANRVAARVDPEVLDDYVGEYQISPGNVVKITREGDHLMEQEPDDPKPEEDLALSSNGFFQREQPGVLTFTRSPDGKVDAYVLWIYDSTIIGKRTTISAQSAHDADVRELERLETVWNEAHEHGDADVLEKLWADDMEVAVPKMPVMTKADVLKFARSGRMKFVTYRTSDIRARLYDNAAVVTGRLQRTRSMNGQEISDDWRFTKTYVREAGKWRVVSFHACEAAQP